MLSKPGIAVLGPEPAHRTFALNGNAFQQDAICTSNGWQYAAFYSSSSSSDSPLDPLYVHLARRKLADGPWETLVFKDYPQTVDDGHNTVQLGICPGDGTIHLAYDHHCDVLRYRYSVRGLTLEPSRFEWTASLFTPTLDHLPGLTSSHKPFGYVTYPRFGAMGDDLFCSLRDGKAGSGDDHLYLYRADDGQFHYVGSHLQGLDSNPYIHGMDYHDGRLHVTWVYRGFVFYEGWDDPSDVKHKQQAGPNGAENNYNICYAYSDDKGYTWKNGKGTVIGSSVRNDSPGITAWKIPKGHGLMNQEAQAVDPDGGVHVLNRDNMDGDLSWKHYYRSPDGEWSQRSLGAVKGGKRGRLAVERNGDLYIILPDSSKDVFSILKASSRDGYAAYEEVWSGSNLSGEPLVDKCRFDYDNGLSIFALAGAPDKPDKKEVVVLSFSL